MRKVFIKIHLWLSVPVGVVISLLCLTGALLVFETELMSLCYPSRYRTEFTGNPVLPLPELMDKVCGQLPDSVTVSSVTIPADYTKNYRMGISGQGRTSILVDPYSGEIKGKVQPYAKGTFFSIVRRLHRWFLFEFTRDSDAINWGRIITGGSTLICVFILITGVMIWLPKRGVSWLKKLKIKYNRGWFRFWHDLHIAGGMYVVIILLIMCLTGLTWSFEWYRNGFYKMFGVELNQQQLRPEQKNELSGIERGSRNVSDKKTKAGAHGETSTERNSSRGHGRPLRGEKQDKIVDYAVWSSVYQDIVSSVSVYQSVTLQNGSASVYMNDRGNIRASDRYSFDTETGEITEVKYYQDSDKSGKLRGWIYSVHTGHWGGLTTRILSLIACLIGATLPITGYYLYFKKLWMKKTLKDRYR